LDVALAVARERLNEELFGQALAFIDFTRDDLAAPRALGIFARLHHLDEEEYRLLKNRVLASYGAQAGAPVAPANTFVAINGDVEWDVTASMINRIRRRLGGRRNMRLRKRVELFSGRVEAALLSIHVDAVCRVVTTFDEDVSVAMVVRTYMEALGVRRALHHAIYTSVLDRLFRELEPATRPAPVSAAAEEPAEARPLKRISAARPGVKAS
jgi:hypothetical protein